MRAKTLITLGCACDVCKTGSGGCVRYPDGKIPPNTVIEHAEAHKLVRYGVAEAADEECAKAIGLSDEQLRQAQRAAKRTALGIHPEDFAAFDAGIMEGYQPDGSYKSGPNTLESEGGIILDGWE